MNNKKNIMCVFFIFLFTISFTSALGCAEEGWRGYAKVGENKTVCVTCPTCNYINITVTNPNSEIYLTNVAMEKDENTFCYVFLGEDIIDVGTFQIDGFSQLDIPLGLCFDATLSGKATSSAAYIIALIFVALSLTGVILLNIKFNSAERDKLRTRMVTEYFKFTSDRNKSNLAYAILYTFAYAILRMIFVIYYLIALIFIVIFTELVTAFSINTFSTLMPQVLNIALLGLILIFVVFIAIFFEIIMNLIKDIGDMLRGIE